MLLQILVEDNRTGAFRLKIHWHIICFKLSPIEFVLLTAAAFLYFYLWNVQVNLLVRASIYMTISAKPLEILIWENTLKNQGTWQVLCKILRSWSYISFSFLLFFQGGSGSACVLSFFSMHTSLDDLKQMHNGLRKLLRIVGN
jgi:hypothetical protein